MDSKMAETGGFIEINPNTVMGDKKERDEPSATSTLMGVKKDREEPSVRLTLMRDKKERNGPSGKLALLEKFSERCLRNSVIVMCVITMVLLMSLLVVTIFWYCGRQEDLKDREMSFCVKCDDLKGRNDRADVLDAFERSTEKEEECCGKTSMILKRLLDKSTKERYIKDLSNNFFASTSEECDAAGRIPENPSAKVSGISLMAMGKDTSPLNRIHWNHTGPLSFFKDGIQYINGNLRITHPGMYHIFSQVRWFINSADALPIIHQVHVYTASSDTHDVVLEGRRSKCELVEDSSEVTSAVGALFELKEGDEIFVTTSKPQHLSPCHHGNFFGLYMVAEAVKR